MQQQRYPEQLTPGCPTETGTYFAVIKSYVNDELEKCVLHYQKHKGLLRAVGHSFNCEVKEDDVVGYVGQPAKEKKYPIGGYAPGNYTCKCCICKKEFQGDKRAVQCEPCAEKAVVPGSGVVGWPLFVINKATGECHEVNKLVYHPENDPEPHVWCDTWYGHHVIGKDCEWYSESPNEQPVEQKEEKNEFVEILDNCLNEGKTVLDELKKQNAEREQKEKDAVGFIRWLRENNWHACIDNDHIDQWLTKTSLHASPIYKTTEQLYKEYKKG